MLIIKKYLKDIILFIIILLLWSISGFIFKIDYNYYNLLKLPFFTLNGKYIAIIWFIIYILITISTLKVSKLTNILRNNDYLYILLTNYISNELFIPFFFKLQSPLLGLIITTITSISAYFFYLETKKISKKASYYLIPYVVYGIYAFILMISIYFMNF